MGKVAEAVKAAPPISVASLELANVSLSDLVLILTSVYTALMIVHKTIVVVQALRKPPGCFPHCNQRRRAGDVP